MVADFKLLIIGGGPAGVAAALQAQRDGTSAALIAGEAIGGLVGAGHRLDNLPGFPGGIAGNDYGVLLQKQILQANINVIADRVIDVRRNDGLFLLHTAGGQSIRGLALILAQGTKPLPLKVKGLEKLETARALHRDVRDLPHDLSGKRVIVIGGGEAAADSALTIRDRGGIPIVVVRGERLKTSPNLAREVEQARIAIRFKSQVHSIKSSNDNFELITEGKDGSFDELPFDRLMVCIGRGPDLELWRMLGGQNAPRAVRTEIDGVFAAGDMIRGIDRYVATAIGDGARSARLVAQFLANRANQGELSV